MTRLKSIPEEMDHSVPIEDRKSTNPAYFVVFGFLQIFWNFLYVWVTFFSEVSVQGNLLSDIPTALLFLVLSVVDVIKRRYIILIAPTIASAIFIFVYLLLLKRLTKYFTIATYIAVALGSLQIISDMDGLFTPSLDLSKNFYGLMTPFIHIILISIYFTIVLICFLNAQSAINEVYKETLSAFFQCTTAMLIGIPAFIIIFFEMVKVTTLDFILWNNQALPLTVLYFLRGFNWFTSICLINVVCNSSQLFIIQTFASWYKTRSELEVFPKCNILSSLKHGFKMFIYHSGTIIYQSIPLVSTVHAFFLMPDDKRRTSRKCENVVRLICKCRLALGINGFINVYTSIYGYNFQKSARKSSEILLQNFPEYHAVIDIFGMIRIWEMSAILYFFAMPVSQEILYNKGYFLVGNGPDVEKINRWLAFLLALAISSLAIVMDFIVVTILNVVLLLSLGDLRNNSGKVVQIEV